MSENPLLPTGYDIAWSALVIAIVVLTVWALVSILRSGMDPVARLVWAIIVLVLPLLGPVLWLAFRTTLRNSGRTT